MDESLKLSLTGFSLIELMVVIAIIGIMTTQIPRLTRIRYSQQEAFVAELNSLARAAYTYALVRGKKVQLFFDLEPGQQKIGIKQEREGDEKSFDWVPLAYITNPISWYNSTGIERCIIDGKDELYGGDLKTFWIFIMPDGICQQATLSFKNEDGRQGFTLELNPFSAQFKVV